MGLYYYIVFSFGYTLVNIPLTPIVTALSSNPAERTKISTTRQVFANLGSLTSSLFVIPMVYFFAGSPDAAGAELASGYRNTNIVLGLIVIVIMCICVFTIVEINPPTQAVAKSTFLQDFGNAFKNKYYIMLLVLIFFMYAGYLGMYGAMQYYYSYIVGDVSAMPTALSLLTILAIPTMLVAAFLNGKGIHKVKITQLGAVIDLIGYIILFFTSSSTVATAALGLIGLGFGFRSGMFFAMMPDVFDYTEWKCGRCLAGTQSAISGFLNKLASAFASAAVSACLTWGGYNASKLDSAIAAGQKIAEVYPKTHMAINFAFSGVSIVSGIIAILVMIPYDLDKKYPEIRAELDSRRTGKSEA